MQKNLKNISLVTLTIFVVFLSIGISVSKMQCSQDGKIFIGKEVPNCMQKKEIVCSMEVKEFSCCKKEKSSVSCCPQMEDDSCASETTDIQFNFETLVAFFQFDFKQIIVLLNTFYLYDILFHLNWYIDYPEGVPLLKIYKPELAELQTFLL